MRSELVFAAKRNLPNRYELCRLLAIGVRKFHTPNTRIEETTDAVLRRLAYSGVGTETLDSANIADVQQRVA
ncbi:MAG TPA: hypothetical protein VMU05_03565 [Dongiaceae bacterium]|nr:hypothetical protein [Dongiaceae bacterium]